MPITIEEAIARVPAWRGAARIVVAPLPGSITNANYRVDVDGEVFVVRIAGPDTHLLGIDRDRELQCMRAAAATGVLPEVVLALPADGLLVTRLVNGRPITPQDFTRAATMARVVAALRRYHEGPPFDGDFSPFTVLQDYLAVARRTAAPLPDDIEALYDHLRGIAPAVGAAALRRPCHNDLWGPNLIDDGARVHIVDWEYAGMGDLFFDLANLAVHQGLIEDGDAALLQAYFGQVGEGALARLRLLKSVAALREAMWCMVALNLAPDADFDFLGYARRHFDRYRAGTADRRFQDWLDLAAAGGAGAPEGAVHHPRGDDARG